MLSLLDLPPEVRVMIYNLLLIPNPRHHNAEKVVCFYDVNNLVAARYMGWDLLNVVCVSTRDGFTGTKNVSNPSLGHGCLRSWPVTSVKFANLSQLFTLATTNKEVISREALPVVYANLDLAIHVDEVAVDMALIRHIFFRLLSTETRAGVHGLRITLRQNQSIKNMAEVARILKQQLPNLKAVSLFLRTHYLSVGGRSSGHPGMGRSGGIGAYFPSIQGLAALNWNVEVIFELQTLGERYIESANRHLPMTLMETFEIAMRREAERCQRYLLGFRKITQDRAEAREKHDKYCVQGIYLTMTLPLRLE